MSVSLSLQAFTGKEIIGFSIGSVSSVLYLCSRVPQMYTNVSMWALLQMFTDTLNIMHFHFYWTVDSVVCSRQKTVEKRGMICNKGLWLESKGETT